MVQKVYPQNLGPKLPPHNVCFSEKNDYLAVQYEDVHGLILRNERPAVGWPVL
jgi:hypothetical protein